MKQQHPLNVRPELPHFSNDTGAHRDAHQDQPVGRIRKRSPGSLANGLPTDLCLYGESLVEIIGFRAIKQIRKKHLVPSVTQSCRSLHLDLAQPQHRMEQGNACHGTPHTGWKSRIVGTGLSHRASFGCSCSSRKRTGSAGATI
ncbi:hypothetical protein [Azospirillum sp. TSO35-2]|uniref:hypothetical protein n=1 Tax=Azospirillum sp. TSO35-2 TaxID=716796 RepID=UPI0018EE5150|nr:hypothetical protein [Azospirillum sp. TSO35-2]